VSLTLEAVRLIRIGETNRAIHEKLGIAPDLIEALRQQIFPEK
jgi:hypothetical protein